jgi:hypothetical protein
VKREIAVHYLYGSKRGSPRKLAATFGSQQQLLAYVRWATLLANNDGTCKFEQGSALSGFDQFESSDAPLTREDASSVIHNPSPSML